MNKNNENIKKKVGIAACSNGLSESSKIYVENLLNLLRNICVEPELSDFLYKKDENGFQGTAEERAEALMSFYKDNNINAVFDISGGDIANEIIPYLDYDIIAKADKTFWGYSDLTTVINAIYNKTGKSSVLYQVRNLLINQEQNTDKINAFINTFIYQKSDLFKFPYDMVYGDGMEGIVVGGNIRCFLKLAGTEYFPDLNGKILLLESMSGDVYKTIAYFSQLKMLGAFDKVNGVLLGTFTELEQNTEKEFYLPILKKYTGNIPLAKTQFIGHGKDSYGVVIGENLLLSVV